MGLNEDISEDEWRQVCKNSQKQLGGDRLKLLHYNWLMQTYITPVKLNRFNKNIPHTCFKCREAQGSFVHCVWECNIIRDFWVEVINITKIILSLNIPPRCKNDFATFISKEP